MFEKDAEEYSTSSKVDYVNNIAITLVQQAYKDGAEFGYNKANEYTITIIQDLLDNSDEYARQRAYEYLDRPCATCRHKAKMLTDKKPCKDCDNGCNWEK